MFDAVTVIIHRSAMAVLLARPASPLTVKLEARKCQHSRIATLIHERHVGRRSTENMSLPVPVRIPSRYSSSKYRQLTVEGAYKSVVTDSLRYGERIIVRDREVVTSVYGRP